MKAETAPRVLVVEDDPDLRDLYADLLEDAGYDVRAAPLGLSSARRLSF
jgi:DNA-binding response OmpR family regulator